MSLKGKTIFIVEDNAGNLAIARFYLEQRGATVKFARWGKDALDIIRRAMPVDLILMDLMLPGKQSGFDVFESMKQAPDLADIPVIAVSAGDADTFMPRAARMGFAGYVSKPVYESITQHVTTVLSGKKVWEGLGNEF